MKHLHLLILAIAVIAAVTDTAAQRRITPVEPAKGVTGAPKNEPDKKEFERSNLAERKDATGNIVLVDTVSGTEWVDTTATVSTKMIYPLWESVSVGLNIWDPAMRILGQEYGGADIWAELSLHNRYKPIVEFGLSSADITPDGMNYTFRSKLAPYFKLGFNYNIFYNNSPDYQFTAGVRYGFTSFAYRVTDVSVGGGYWDDSTSFNIPRQSCTAGYFELVAGVKVMIVKHLSLGWNVKYHSILHESKAPYGKPMYVPGYGKRGNPFTASFSIIYTFTLNKPDTSPVNTGNDSAGQ